MQNLTIDSRDFDFYVIPDEEKKRLNQETAILVYQDLIKELKKRVFGVYSWIELFRDVGKMTLVSERYLHGCVLQKRNSIPYENKMSCLRVVVYVLENMVEYRHSVLTGEVNGNGSEH